MTWRHLYVPVAKLVKEVVNPRVRGWVNYFRWGNAGHDLSYVAWQVDMKVRRLNQAAAQRLGSTCTKYRDGG